MKLDPHEELRLLKSEMAEMARRIEALERKQAAAEAPQRPEVSKLLKEVRRGEDDYPVLYRGEHPEFGVVRLSLWPEGLVLWVGGQIRWTSWSGAAAPKPTPPGMLVMPWQSSRVTRIMAEPWFLESYRGVQRAIDTLRSHGCEAGMDINLEGGVVRITK